MIYFQGEIEIIAYWLQSTQRDLIHHIEHRADNLSFHSTELKADTSTEQSKQRATGKPNLERAAGTQRLEKGECEYLEFMAAAEERRY